MGTTVDISTHTSRVGCDGNGVFFNDMNVISTHTSRVGCDKSWMKNHITATQFLLTHPVWDVTWCPWFYRNTIPISTHTSRVGCDYQPLDDNADDFISTHTSRVGCDHPYSNLRSQKMYFYSHIPCGM